MAKIYYLYRMRCTECKKFYIGITVNPRKRLKSHLSVEKLPWKGLTKFGRAVKRYGSSTFTMEIIGKTTDVDEISELETKWIKRLGKKRLWNSTYNSGGSYIGKYHAAGRKNREEVCKESERTRRRFRKVRSTRKKRST